MEDLAKLWASVSVEAVGFREKLLKLGLSERLLNARAVGFTSISLWRLGTWVPKPGGERAIILPCCASDGDLLDLVAFYPDRPRSFWRHTGHGWLLGSYFLEMARELRAPLMVHETPLGWVTGRDFGVCVLDWQVHWPEHLVGIPRLRCADVDFGQRLQAALMRPFPIPGIEVAV